MLLSNPAPGALVIQPLFPVALGQVQLRPEPLDLALQLQELHALRGDACSNPDPSCAWTGDLNGVWQLHHNATFVPLIRQLVDHAQAYLVSLGFDLHQISLHIQRCWPVMSEAGQVVGRHHHPNAHLSAVYYLTGDGSGRCGSLRFWPQRQINELVPGLAVGHGAPLGEGCMGQPGWTNPWIDVAPQAGLLVLFPAGLDHGVLPNQDDQNLRCSLSIDFVLTAAPCGPGQAPPEYLAPHPGQWDQV